MIIRRAARLLMPLVFAGLLLAGCGEKRTYKRTASAKPITVSALQFSDFKFTVSGENVTLRYTPPNTDREITINCAELGENGFERKVSVKTTWRKGQDSLAVRKPENVRKRDLCAAKLGEKGLEVIGFLSAKAKRLYVEQQQGSGAK